MMNRNRVFRRAALAIECATRALRFRGKTDEAAISTASSRAILAHPGKEFLSMTGAPTAHAANRGCIMHCRTRVEFSTAPHAAPWKTLATQFITYPTGNSVQSNGATSKIGRKFFIIAPRGVFDFQQDYIDLEGVRYYALRIPYSIINELHHRDFTALKQPNDEMAVNETVDAVGFDFIRPPKVDWSAGVNKRKGQLLEEAFLKVRKFQSYARLRGEETCGGLDTFSMLMLDFDYVGDVFDLDAVFYAQQLEESDWEARLPVETLGEQVMAVFIDIHGNEARDLIPRDKFGVKVGKAVRKTAKKAKT